ncbi:uncharacterized protein RCC_09596 [Ramularia collo-cygni]|uniref:Thioester reductase (TE) domain-containing protein n=1 Tax=Ramularia collo-cygni TaxID=112498 RepID=A0A2D3VHY9_9PEZI|nr:uncharacterized protein RCC_09596 [Ramularia collo-cygni]CZT23881.1 uncharacterized protein RCC_09596 [Ramularia collo-cygni]
MIRDKKFGDLLRSFKNIQIGSGPMPKVPGDILLGINPNTAHFFGSTETYLMPLLQLQDPVADWQYHRFHPLSGATFEIVQEGLVELVVERLEGIAQPCFSVHPGMGKFHTKDVFSRHPSKPDLWKFECRLDDVIMFETDEKMIATDIERKVTSLPGMRAALVIGQGERRPTLLLELLQGVDPVTILEETWREMEKFNATLPRFGQLVRNLITVASTPFLRTAKGTIQRRASGDALKVDIDRLYEQYQDPAAITTLTTAGTEADVSAFLNTVTVEVLGRSVGSKTDLLSSGVDSLQVAHLVRSVNKGLAASSDSAIASTRITPAALYSYRSTSELAKRVKADIQDCKEQATLSATRPNQKHHSHHHKDMLHQHRTKLPKHSGRKKVDLDVHSLQNTILTGSTGNLGPHILHRLLKDDNVKQITCLNRAPDARTQYLSSFPNDAPLLPKVKFLTTSNLNSPSLGLDPKSYNSLQSHTTTNHPQRLASKFPSSPAPHNRTSRPNRRNNLPHKLPHHRSKIPSINLHLQSRSRCPLNPVPNPREHHPRSLSTRTFRLRTKVNGSWKKISSTPPPYNH